MSLGVGLDSASLRDTSFVQPKPYFTSPSKPATGMPNRRSLPEAQSRRDGAASSLLCLT